MKNHLLSQTGPVLIALILSACNGQGTTSAINMAATPAEGLVPGQTFPSYTPVPNVPVPPKPTRNYTVDALIFVGSGTWSAETASLRNTLINHGATFDEVGSDELNTMTLGDLIKYGVMIFPGGSGGTQAGSLTQKTHENLRKAVQQNGVGYLGFCAGAFIAVAPAPAPGKDVSYGLGIVNGPVLDYYYLEDQGIDISMTLYSFANGTTMDILWYGGPVTPNIPGGVVAKYPDGNPAISQMWSGNGLVVLAGGHPSATQSTLASLGVSSSDGTHQELVWELFYSALHQEPMPAF